ncbi:MAG: protein kinase [Deltaproteobacteria bacterium]|nr:protein kinase [Deltaproteobacteria bacterium]
MDAQTSLRYCPLCRRHFRQGVAVCPADGTGLLPHAAPLPAKGSVLEGRFVLLESIGQGGMAEVFRALDGLHRKECAVKLMRTAFAGDERSIRQFFTEARTVRRLRHPNIIRIVGFGCTVDGHPYMAMELLRGWSLASVLRTRGALPASRAIPIFLQLMDALDAAHRHGVVHRDLKPENVYLVPREDGGERVKLLDFGISQFRGVAVNGGNEICGTPTYMSPEQVRGRPAVPQTDLYSAGVLLYEMLTGVTPFQGKRSVEVLKCHLKSLPRRISELLPDGGSAALDRLVARMLAKRPDQRPESAAAVAAELMELFRDVEALRLPGDERLAALAGAAAPAQRGTLALSYATREAGIRRPHLSPDSPEFRAYLDLYLKPTLLEEETLSEPFAGAPPMITHGARIGFDHEHEVAAEARRRAAAPDPGPVVQAELALLHARLTSVGEEPMEGDTLRDRVAAPLERWFDGLAAAGAVVCHDVGDRFKILFGLDGGNAGAAALRAVEAARDLSLLVETEGLRGGLALAAQVGVVTGTVHAQGEDLAALVDAVEGSCLDVAQRLSGVAPAGGVVLDEDTRRALPPGYRTEKLVLLRMRGAARTRQTWLLLGDLPAREPAPRGEHLVDRPWAPAPTSEVWKNT